MKKLTKLFSLILTFCILASCMTFTAMADTITYLDLSSNKTFFALNESDTIKVYSGATQITDLSGYTFSSSNENCFTVDSSGNIQATSKAGRSVITVSNGTLTNKYIVLSGSGTNGGTLRNLTATTSDPAGRTDRSIYESSNGTIEYSVADNATIVSSWIYFPASVLNEGNRDAIRIQCAASTSMDIGINYNGAQMAVRDVATNSWYYQNIEAGWYQFAIVCVPIVNGETTTYKLSLYYNGQYIMSVERSSAMKYISFILSNGKSVEYIYNPVATIYDSSNEPTAPEATTTLTGIDTASFNTKFEVNVKANIGEVYASYKTVTPAWTDIDGNLTPEAVATENKAVTEGISYTSADTSILEIDSATGEVTPKKAGSTTVTVSCTYKSEQLSSEVPVTVYGSELLGIDFTEATLTFEAGKATPIEGIYKIAELTDGTTSTIDRVQLAASDVEFVVSDENILTIADGKVTANKTGTTKVSASYEGFTKEMLFTVYDSKYDYEGTAAAQDPVYESEKTVYSAMSTSAASFAYSDDNDYTISTWFYDDTTTALSDILLFKNGKTYTLSAEANAKYYRTEKYYGDGTTYYTIDKIERTTGWHQLTAVIGAGSGSDNVDSRRVTIYIDGKKADFYEYSGFPIVGTLYWVTTTEGYITPVTVTSNVPNASVVETMPADGAVDVPLYTAFSVTFEGEISNYENAFTVTADGKTVPYRTVLSTSGKKVTLDMGKLKAGTAYTVAMSGVKVGDNTASDKTYTFTTRASEDNYLETMLDTTAQSYELVYQRYSDFADSTKLPKEYGVDVVNKSADEIDVSINNGALSIAFDATDARNAEVQFINANGGSPINTASPATIVGQSGAVTDPELMVIKYKYKIKVGEITASTDEEKEQLDYLTRNEFYALGDVKSYWKDTKLNLDYVVYGGANQPYFDRFVDASGHRYKLVLTTVTGQETAWFGGTDITSDEDWVDVTYVINRKSSSTWDTNNVTYEVRLEKVRENEADCKFYSFTGTKSTQDAGFYSINQKILGLELDAFTNNDAINPNVAATMEICDYQIYGFDKKDTYGNLTAYIAANGAATAENVVTNDMAGKTVIATLSATVAEEKTASVIFALFDTASNKLVACSVKSATLATGENTVSSDVLTAPSDEGKTYELKAFVWTTDISGKNTMIPVFSAPTYSNNN